MGTNESSNQTDSEAQETWKSFYKRQGLQNFIPKDPYSHQASLLYPHNLTVEDFADLLNQHLLLGYEEDEEMLKYYQEEIYFITSIFAMSKEAPNIIKPLFNMVYYPFVIGIRLTSILDGNERKMQSFVFKETMKRRKKWYESRKKKGMPDYQEIILPEEDYWSSE